MAEVTPDATNIATFLAKYMVKGGPKRNELAEAISEVELQTQTKGSSFIKIHMNDPEWTIATSGTFDRNSEGLLPKIEVEFPQHTGSFWVLCAVELSNELSQPNFILTLEDKIVRQLKEKWGSKRAAPGFNTRAEFIKALCIEAGVKYHIPSVEGAQDRLGKEITAIHEVLATAEKIANTITGEKEASKTTLTPEGEAAAKANALKTPGISVASGVTVKGVPALSTQIATMNEVMGIAVSLKAPQLAVEALIVACIVESEFGRLQGGLLQFEAATAKGKTVEVGNVGQEVDAVMNDPGASGAGGMISLARKQPNAPAYQIAQQEQASGAGAASDGAANYGRWVKEAQKIIAAYGGVKAKGGGGGDATSKEGEVSRGTSQNPSENSWDCIVRLAGAVNFSVFTNGKTLFYLDGPELVQQKPSAFIYPAPNLNKLVTENAQGHKTIEVGVIQVPLTSTFDDTAVEYFEDHKIKGKVQKKSRIGRPQSPSELKLNVICGVTQFAAGEVWESLQSGPLDGRWIIVDATRNCFKDRFTQFTFEPPSAPIFESEEGKPDEQPAAINPTTGAVEPMTSGEGVVAGGTAVPRATWNPNDKPIAEWIIPIVKWVAKHGWSGEVVSGYRTDAEQLAAAARYSAELGVPESQEYPNGPLASNHCKKAYPGGAIDVTDPEGFNSVLQGYPGKPTLIWGGTTIEDAVHFSATGH